jgi:hypothetical protein
MRRTRRDPARRLQIAVERLPRHTKEAMLRGIDTNRIIVGAYVDPRSGGICPMLAAHRNGGRTSVASFARAWDEYSGARRARRARRPRRATRREVRALRSLLERSLDLDPLRERTPIAELAAQIRAERARIAACPAPQPELAVPESDAEGIRISRRRPRRDLLSATEQALAPPSRAGS